MDNNYRYRALLIVERALNEFVHNHTDDRLLRCKDCDGDLLITVDSKNYTNPHEDWCPVRVAKSVIKDLSEGVLVPYDNPYGRKDPVAQISSLRDS